MVVAAIPNWLWFSLGPLLVGFWMLVSVLAASVGGWATLSRSYRAVEPVLGAAWGFQSGTMRWGTGYNGILHVAVNEEGMGVSVLFLLRLGHPPLYFPWSDVSARWTRLWWLIPAVRLEFTRAPGIPIYISPKLAERIEDEIDGVWLLRNDE